jgi:thiamine kinase-like enzyme
VYRVKDTAGNVRETAERPARTYVVKIFSKLAKIRTNKNLRNKVDEIAEEIGVAPRLLKGDPDFAVHEFVAGRTLTEDDLASDPKLAMRIAKQLAKLHARPPPRDPEDRDGTETILWSSIKAMVEHIRLKPSLLPSGFTVLMIDEAVYEAKNVLKDVPLREVTGHGDFKPSNVMLNDSDENSDVKFIDFELAGRNYRGFDIFKLFRRGQPSAGGKITEMSHDNLKSFIRTYKEEIEGQGNTADPLDVMIDEAYLFESLTWLEAAIFFLYAIQEDPDNIDQYANLARHRWAKFEETKGALHQRADELKAKFPETGA